MFTLKLYGHDGRRLILSAQNFTILADDMRGFYEITAHQTDQNLDRRYDIGNPDVDRDKDWPPLFVSGIIENAAGKTTEILRWHPSGQVPKAA